MSNSETAYCALGGSSIGWRGRSFTVWKVPPRRVQTRCVRFNQEKFGDERRAVAQYYQLERIETTSPAGQRGIEFTTSVEPHRGSGSPYEARWYYPDTPGVLLRTMNNEDFAAIPADVINMQP